MEALSSSKEDNIALSFLIWFLFNFHVENAAEIGITFFYESLVFVSLVEFIRCECVPS